MQTQTITQIYKQYKLMPNLQEHQLRVAALASFILDHLDGSINQTIQRPDVINACLLHDMGNIIKFDLSLFPEFREPEGLEYWQTVQSAFITTYGPDEHLASLAIARELGQNEQVLHYIESIGFRQAQNNQQTDDVCQKICAYTDMRVGPFGIIPLEERFEDLRQRYQKKYAGSEHESKRQQFENSLRNIETQLQAVCTVQLSEITDLAVSGTIDTLQNWQLTLPSSWNSDL